MAFRAGFPQARISDHIDNQKQEITLGDWSKRTLSHTSADGPPAVFRRGGVVYRESQPWDATVNTLLRHLEAVGFPASPRVVGSEFDANGRQTLSYIPGEFTHPGPWSEEGAFAIGHLVKQLHEATAAYRPPADAVWRPWFGRSLGGSQRTISHCDVAPWNIVARDGLPAGPIDWEHAGPVDPLVELAEACWLNAKLHDDLVAERDGLPPLEERARHLRAIVDGYGLPARRRRGFVDCIIAFTVCDTAEQADEFGITHDSTDTRPLWGLTWRARAAAWQLRHRRVLQSALA